MLNSVLRSIVGTSSDRNVKRMWPLVEGVLSYEPSCVAMTDAVLRSQTALFRERLVAARTWGQMGIDARAIGPVASDTIVHSGRGRTPRL